MKKVRLTYMLSLTFLFALAAGCKKSSAPNPCDDIRSEGMPTQVGFIFIDKQTNENILLSKNIDTSVITITPLPLDINLSRGVIVKQPGSPMNGALMFTIVDQKEGTFKYKIDIAGVGSTTLSYTNKKVQTDNKCKAYDINIADPKIDDHPFIVTKTGSRLIFKVTL